MTDMPVIIRSERLVLREFSPDDVDAVHEYATDPEVVRFMPWGPNTEDETRAFIARSVESQGQDPRRVFELAVTLAEDGKLIGGCGIRVSAPSDRGADMGYCLRRDCWGLGLGTEAARAMVGFGFERLGMHRILATCDTKNVASSHVLDKIGMRREARYCEDSLIRGEWRDSYLYAILECEWRSHRGDA